MGWSWSYDAGVRLSEAVPGVGSLSGQVPAASETADRFTFTYGAGDELLERLRQATGEVDGFTSGDYGRIASRDGVAFSYDGVGRRLEDDRFVYRWDWRGQLVEVTVRDSWPDGEVSPYAGHRLSYDYDAGGRLHRRLHEGVDSGDGTRPFIEERRYVWESDRMAVEAGYGADGGLRWRHTYVPGPMGLDDAPQGVVEIFQPGSPFSGEARTYTYLTDELGTVVGLVAEDEGTDPNNPPVPVRYRYTPYGEAHVETGPKLLRARFDGDVTAVETGSGTVEQTVADEAVAAAGGLKLHWSVPLDGASLDSGVVVERLASGGGWQAVSAAVGGRASDGVGTGDDGTELRVVLADGWERGASYRVRLAPGLADELGRPFGRSETLQWSVPSAATESVRYERRWATEYETFEAARATVGGRMPGGQGRLFQGLWTDPVTGVSHARARWYDARNSGWLSEDPLGDVDSVNLYAFVRWQPSMGLDPYGEATLQESLTDGELNPHEIVNLELSQLEIEAIIGSQDVLKLATAEEADYQRKNQARSEFILLARNKTFREYFDASYLLLRGLNPVHHVFETSYSIGSGEEPVMQRQVNRGEKILELTAYFAMLKGADWLMGRVTQLATPTGVGRPQHLLYRGERSSRGPDVVFERGFAPKGTEPDLILHQTTSSAGSAYVPTSKSLSIAEEFAGKNGWVYVVRTDKGYIDLNRVLGAQSRHPYQQEVAIPGGITPDEIVGAYRVEGGKVTGDLILNPRVAEMQ